MPEPLPSSNHPGVYINNSTVPNAGEGLFLAQSVKKNTIIMKIEDYIVLDSDFSIQRAPCPHDGVIHILSGRTKVRALDKQWFDRRPLWHWMNHSKRPNTAMRMKNGLVQWVSLEDIEYGSELLFNYDTDVSTNFDHDHEANMIVPETYCICGGVDYGTPMIECEECGLWCHAACIDIMDEELAQLERGEGSFRCSGHESRMCLCRMRRASPTVLCMCGLEFHPACLGARADITELKCGAHVQEDRERRLYRKTSLYKDGYVVLRSAVSVIPETVARARERVQRHGGHIFNHHPRKKNDKKRIQAKLGVREGDLPGFSHVAAILGLPESTSHSFVVLRSLAGCQAQPAHMDYEIQPDHDPTSFRFSHGAVIAIERGTKLDVWPGAHHYIGSKVPPDVPIDRKTVVLNPGDVCVFRGDCVHAGSSYQEENTRLHCYMDIPEMKHPHNAFFQWQAALPHGVISDKTTKEEK